jgi:hypothetical protein
MARAKTYWFHLLFFAPPPDGLPGLSMHVWVKGAQERDTPVRLTLQIPVAFLPIQRERWRREDEMHLPFVLLREGRGEKGLGRSAHHQPSRRAVGHAHRG